MNKKILFFIAIGIFIGGVVTVAWQISAQQSNNSGANVVTDNNQPAVQAETSNNSDINVGGGEENNATGNGTKVQTSTNSGSTPKVGIDQSERENDGINDDESGGDE